METMLLEKKEGIYDLRPLINWLSNAHDGTYRIDVKMVRRRRTLDQNAWLWGGIYPLLRIALNAQGWEFVNDEQVHEFFKAQMAADQVINKHTGEVIEIPRSTREMDTLTFSTYCDKLRDYGREYLGVEIPDPIPAELRCQCAEKQY